MTLQEARVKHPDAVYSSDKPDKSESAFYSALLGKSKKKNPAYQAVKMENSFPAAHKTLVLPFIQERRAMFKCIIPCVASRWQRPGLSMCGAFSSLCVCAHEHKSAFPGAGVAFIIKTPKGDK